MADRFRAGEPQFHQINTRSLILLLIITAMLSIAISVAFTCFYVGKVHLSSAAFQAQATVPAASSGGQCSCFITPSRYGGAFGSDWAGGCCTAEDTTSIYEIIRQNVAEYNPTTNGQSQGTTYETSTKPMAHLTGIPQTIETGTETESLIRDWESENGMAHTQQIGFSDGRLEVQQTGYYYVYSQVTFSQDSSVAATESPLSIIDKLTRNQLVHLTRKEGTFGDDRDLMRGAQSKSWSPTQVYGVYSSYHGGLFLLQAGDRISVKISTANADLLSLEESKCYFGMFLVS